MSASARKRIRSGKTGKAPLLLLAETAGRVGRPVDHPVRRRVDRRVDPRVGHPVDRQARRRVVQAGSEERGVRIRAREIRLGLKTLMLHKLRSMLTMLGVVFGVGSVIAMLAVGEGASRNALEQIRKLGSTNILVRSMQPAEEASAQRQRARVSMYGLTYQDHLRLEKTIPDIRRVVPVKVVRQPGQMGNKVMDMRLVGTTSEWFELVRRPVLAGRVLNDVDIQGSSFVVVLTERGARRLLAGENTIGQEIRIGGVFFQVVGIVQSENSESGAVQMPDSEVDAYVPLSITRARWGDVSTRITAGSRVRERVELHQVIVEATEPERVARVASAIEHALVNFHGQKDYDIAVPLALLRQAEA